jgi:hypothetical protein
MRYQPPRAEVQMRTLTLLIIAGVVGSIAVGSLTRNADTASPQDAKLTLKTLFARDKAAALRMLERTASACIPELAQVKSNNGRKLFPRILLVRLDTMDRSGDALTRDEAAVIDKEVDRLVRAVPESDFTALTAALERMEKEKTKVQNCISNALGEVVRNEKRKQDEVVLPDVELRGL